MTGRVLVNGADSFIGRAVVAHLARAGVDVVSRDLDAPGVLAETCAGASTIVHLGGRARAQLTAHLRTLLDAAGGANVDQIVLFSSIAVYGDRQGAITEDDDPGDLDAYGATRRTCETMLRAWLDEGATRSAMILRPGIVYGRGDDLWVERPAAALRAGALGHLGPGGDGIAALIHISDVAAATPRGRRSAEEPRAGRVRDKPRRARDGRRGTPISRRCPNAWASASRRRTARSAGRRGASSPHRRRSPRASASPSRTPCASCRLRASGDCSPAPRATTPARLERVLGVRPSIGLARGLEESLPSPEPVRRAA